MRDICLIHSHTAEGEARRAELAALGWQVSLARFTPRLLREMENNPPRAVVIDLDRSPSQGRDIGLAIRIRKGTRRIPLLFAGGSTNKVAAVQRLLPDAAYGPWEQVHAALQHAIAHPPQEPIVPPSAMAGYAEAPLPKKLGIKHGSSVLLVDAPQGFEQALPDLPEGAHLHKGKGESSDLTLWFVTFRRNLEHGIAGMTERAQGGKLWILWPKRTSGVDTDLTQSVVREAGLQAGMVDFKVCSVDEVWSGLRFTLRAQKGPRQPVS
jgi:hypothetical protein